MHFCLGLIFIGGILQMYAIFTRKADYILSGFLLQTIAIRGDRKRSVTASLLFIFS